MSAVQVAIDKRKAPRRRVLKAGYIKLTEKRQTLSCIVRNLSSTGACLELESTTLGIPKHFVLTFDGSQHSCQIIWRTEAKMGVVFI
jgi:hypothetical protein